MTAAELAKRKRAERRERERDARKADRARLRALRLNIRRSRQLYRARRREVVQLCREGRERTRTQTAAYRLQVRLAANEAIAVARAQSRNACEQRKARVRSTGSDSLGRAAAVLAAEQKHQHSLALWSKKHPSKSSARGGKRAAGRRAESDDEVRNNLPAELVPVWAHVQRARFKATPRRTRTETFLEWAAEHPGDVLSIVDQQTEDDVARLVAAEHALRKQMLRPSTYRRATDAELQARADVPF